MPHHLKKKVLASSILLCHSITIGGLISLSSTASAEGQYVFQDSPIFPNAKMLGGSGRFGEHRTGGNRGEGFLTGRAHGGVDLSGNKQSVPLYAIADSKLVTSGDVGGGYGLSSVFRPLNGPDIIAVYNHMRSQARGVSRVGTVVKSGSVIGAMGGTSSPAPGAPDKYPIHLHFGVGVAAKKYATDAWISPNPRNGASLILSDSTTATKTGTMFSQGKTYYFTNPAPYMTKDSIYTQVSGVDRSKPYLGNSIRTHYNAVTGANLPIVAPAKMGPLAGTIPKLRVNGSPAVVPMSEQLQEQIA